MSASHGRCENGKRTKNVSGKGVVYQNNTLNINLMYSCCLLHISSANSAAIVKNANRLARLNNLYIAMHYSVTALQRYS